MTAMKKPLEREPRTHAVLLEGMEVIESLPMRGTARAKTQTQN
jgi:hypothetical protein